MSSDALKILESNRNYYRSQNTVSKSETERELKEIKNELQILNETQASSAPVTNATGSPYLSDQEFSLKNIIYNSSEETSWKEVKSYDELYQKTSTYNLKKLNII